MTTIHARDVAAVHYRDQTKDQCCAQKAVLLGSVTVKYNLRTKVISHSSLHRYPQDTVTSLNNWDEPINYPSSTFSVSLIPRPPARLHLTAVEKNKD